MVKLTGAFFSCVKHYLQAAYNYLVKIDPEVTKYMKRIPPINWEHITFLVEYKFDLLSIPKHLRELNIENKEVHKH